MTDLTDMEMEVLRICGGEKVPGWCWGAGMAACLEGLTARGLITCGWITCSRFVMPTERGQTLLDEYYAREANHD